MLSERGTVANLPQSNWKFSNKTSTELFVYLLSNGVAPWGTVVNTTLETNISKTGCLSLGLSARTKKAHAHNGVFKNVGQGWKICVKRSDNI